ncbi:hypothetical protein ACSBR2_004213 [Camellia fascicularis]
MAIPSSPDWSVTSSINYSKTTTTHKSVFPLDSKFKSLHFLCLPFRNLRVFMPNSTGCPSPILEDPSSSTTQPPPILQLNPKIQHFTAEDEDAHFLSGGDVNGFICSLFEGPQTQELAYNYYEKAKQNPDYEFLPKKSTLNYLIRIREVKIAEELLMEAESNKMLRDPAVFLKLVLMYVEEGLLEKTKEIVAAMKRVKIRVSDCIFCAIVNGFSKRRGLRVAIEVYEDMILEGCEPGQVTYASIINVYYRLGLYLKAEKAFSEMENKGFDRCIVAYSNMVAMYGKAGKLRDAMRLVAKMKERGCEPNVWIYNSLLDMHGRLLKLRQVEKIWKEMKRRKIVADKVSYTSVISTYSKAREFETCMKYYHEFRINGGVIDRAMAGIMVGVFSKMSRIDELVKLLQDMKTEGTQLDGRLYRSALNALRDAGLQVQAKWLQQSFGIM